MHKSFYISKNKAICAGGIIFYQQDGFWLLKELTYSPVLNFNFNYTDPGGKYEYADVNIYNCIIREFNEETYFSYCNDFTVNDLYKLKKNNKIKKIDILKNNWVYRCLLINIEDTIFKNKTFCNKKFFLNRLKCLNENKLHSLYYSSFQYCLVKYNKFKSNWNIFSPRLKEICLNIDFISKYI